ncbi:hypothetical protein [Marinobacter subterrani]
MGETEDYKTLSESLPVFVDMGARIPTWWLHERTGIPERLTTTKCCSRNRSRRPLA